MAKVGAIFVATSTRGLRHGYEAMTNRASFLRPSTYAAPLLVVSLLVGCGSDDDTALFGGGGSGGAGTGGRGGEGGAASLFGKGGSSGKTGTAGASGKGSGGKAGATGKGGAGGKAGAGGTSGKGGAGQGGATGKGGSGSAGKGGASAKGGAAGSGDAGAGGTGAGGTGEAGAGGSGAAGEGGTDAGGTGGTGGTGGSGDAGAGGAGTGGTGVAPLGPLGPPVELQDWTDECDVVELAATKTRVVWRCQSFGNNFVDAKPIAGGAFLPIDDDEQGFSIVGMSANGQDERVLIDRDANGGGELFASDGKPQSFPALNDLFGVYFFGEGETAWICGGEANGPNNPSDGFCYDGAQKVVYEKIGGYPNGGGAGLLAVVSGGAGQLYNVATKKTAALGTAASEIRRLTLRGDSYALVRACPECNYPQFTLALEWGTVPAGFPDQPFVRQGRLPIASVERFELRVTPSHVMALSASTGELQIARRDAAAYEVEIDGVTAIAVNPENVFYAQDDIIYRRALP